MKAISIVGARPQFIKAATLLKLHPHILIHTGQHYDYSMSRVFFEDLDIPKPDYNLNIGSFSHGVQTAKMLMGIEEILLEEAPDWVIVYGDTNSTLAGALAASKLHIPVAHVEAGLRSYNREMPEEINRVLTDHISTLLLCPTKTAVINLARESVVAALWDVYMVGDVMYDAALHYANIARSRPSILDTLDIPQGGLAKPPLSILSTPDVQPYILVTVHRPRNTDDHKNLSSILDALNDLDEPVIFPIHPRTYKAIQGHCLKSHIELIQPVGYLDMLTLEKAARLIITDSGGVQKEAYFFGVPCVTLREETEWIETVETGWNVLVGADAFKIKRAIQNFQIPTMPQRQIFGDGHAAEKIVSLILETT